MDNKKIIKFTLFFCTQKEPIDIDVDLLYFLEKDLEVRLNEQTGHQNVFR